MTLFVPHCPAVSVPVSYSKLLEQATQIINPLGSSSAVIDLRQVGLETSPVDNEYSAWFYGRKKLLLKMAGSSRESGRVLLVANGRLLIQLTSARRPIELSTSQWWDSDASYAQMARADFSHDYQIISIAREAVDGPSVHFELAAKEQGAAFRRVDLWVRPGTGMPVRAIFELSVARSRICEYKSLRKVIGQFRPTRFIFTERGRANWKTEMQFSHWKRQKLDAKWFIPSALTKVELRQQALLPLAPYPAHTVSGSAPPAGMVFVAAGPFVMGRDGGFPDESPTHTVILSDYWIDRYEVTLREFQRFLLSQGKVFAPLISSDSLPQDYFVNPAYRDFPVVNVNWAAAREYCQFVGKRLPKEAEWEKAARGTDGRLYPWGNQWAEGRANSRETRFRSLPAANLHFTSRVGQYSDGVGPYGTMDMAGNVAEWVEDWYGPYPDNNDVPAEAYKQKYKVVRGGSWIASSLSLTVVARDYSDPRFGYESIGFRCAADKPPASHENGARAVDAGF
jgi:formylglycine-generating enzyme required for sulfatase activity